MIVAPAATGAVRGEMIGVHAVMADRQGETIVALAGTIAAPAEMRGPPRRDDRDFERRSTRAPSQATRASRVHASRACRARQPGPL